MFGLLQIGEKARKRERKRERRRKGKKSGHESSKGQKERRQERWKGMEIEKERLGVVRERKEGRRIVKNMKGKGGRE